MPGSRARFLVSLGLFRKGGSRQKGRVSQLKPTAPVLSPPPVAAFDVDGTLTWTDSFVLFLRFVAGDAQFGARMARLAPAFMAHKAGALSRGAIKGRVVAAFFTGMEVARYHELCALFAASAYPLIGREDALERLRSHAGAGDTVAFVSASLEDYLAPWAAALGVEAVLATGLDSADGRLTGRLRGRNCWGPEKLSRVRAAWPAARLAAAYGDSRGDREMLAAAAAPAYRVFHDRPEDARERVRAILAARPRPGA